MKNILAVMVLFSGLCAVASEPDAAPRASGRALPRLWPEGRTVERVERRLRETQAMFGSPERFRSGIEQARAMPHFPEPFPMTTGPLTWQPIGIGIHAMSVPSPPSVEYVSASGRATSLQYGPSPRDGSQILYLGSVGGGIWRLESFGPLPLWVAASDTLPGPPSVGDFVVHRDDPNRIMIGTGDTTRYLGDGLYRSIDAGASWVRVTSLGGPPNFNRVVADPADPDLVLAAHTWGLARTEDFGITWPFVAGLPGGEVTDVVRDPGDSQRWLAAVRATGIYESGDAGQSWTPITPEPGADISGFRDRIHLTICEDDPSYVYALVAGNGECSGTGGFTGTLCEDDADCAAGETCKNKVPSGVLAGIYRSSDGGTNWTAIESVDTLSWGTGTYTGAIAVDPTDCARLFVGMGGMQWTENATAVGEDIVAPVMWRRHFQNKPPFCDADGDGTIDLPNTADCDLALAHADHTRFLFEPGTTRVLNANDGGYYYFNYAGNSWDDSGNLQGLHTTQLVGGYDALSGFYGDADRLVSGTQDNGVVRIDKNEPHDLQMLVGGDGGQCSISPNDPQLYFFSQGIPWSRLYMRGEDPNQRQDVDCGLMGQNAMVRAHPMPGFDPDRMFTHDLQDVYYQQIDAFCSVSNVPCETHDDCTGGAGDLCSEVCSWNKANGEDIPEDLTIRMFDMGHGPDYVFYVTTDSGRVLKLDEQDGAPLGAMAWHEITPPLDPMAAMIDARLYADDSALQPDTIYYSSAISSPAQMFVSLDRGNSWIEVTGNVSAMPSNSTWRLVGNPSNLDQMFLATGTGVYRTEEALAPADPVAGPTWGDYSDGLPQNIRVLGMQLSYDSSPTGRPILHIGSFGRGYWEKEVFPAEAGPIPGTDGVPGDPLVLWRSPQDPDEIMLGWSPSCMGSDEDYTVFEGELGVFDSHKAALCSTGGETTVSYVPEPGSRYFLISTVSTSGQEPVQGVLGYDSTGTPRAAASPCFPMVVGECF